MDSLVPLFVAVLLAETGGATQTFAHSHGKAGLAGPGIVALMIAGVVNYSIAAVAGTLLGPTLPEAASKLLFALGLILAGLPMLLRPGSVPVLASDSRFGWSLFGFLRTQLGDAGQFLVFAIAAHHGNSPLALTGALFAMTAASLPPMLIPNEWPARRIRWARLLCAVLLMITGFVTGINIMGLVGG